MTDVNLHVFGRLNVRMQFSKCCCDECKRRYFAPIVSELIKRKLAKEYKEDKAC